MEVEEQNALNFIEIRKRQAEINVWKDEQQSNPTPTFSHTLPPLDKVGEFPNHIQHEFKNI